MEVFVIMKKYKKAVAGIVCLTLALLLFVSCGESPVIFTKIEVPTDSPETDLSELQKQARWYLANENFTYHNILNNTTDNVMLNNIYHDYLVDNEHIYAMPGRSTFIKLNNKTGLVSSVCTDAGCLHYDKSCPLYGLDIFMADYVKDGIIYYTSDLGNEWGYYAYNMNTSELSLLMTASQGYSSAFHYENKDYWFFTVGILKDDADPEKPESYENAIIRMDKKSKKTKTIQKSSDNCLISVLFVVDDRDLFCTKTDEDGKRSYCLMDEEGNLRSTMLDSKKKYDCVVGNNAVFVETDGVIHPSLLPEWEDFEVTYRDEKGSVHSEGLPTIGEYADEYIYVADMTTGKTKKLVESPVFFHVYTDEYVYYTEHEPFINGECDYYGYTIPDVMLTKGELYRIRYDGSGKELVTCGFAHEFIGSKFVVGDYVYALLFSEYDKESGHTKYDRQNKLVRADLTNGEIYVMKWVSQKETEKHKQ